MQLVLPSNYDACASSLHRIDGSMAAAVSLRFTMGCGKIRRIFNPCDAYRDDVYVDRAFHCIASEALLVVRGNAYFYPHGRQD